MNKRFINLGVVAALAWSPVASAQCSIDPYTGRQICGRVDDARLGLVAPRDRIGTGDPLPQAQQAAQCRVSVRDGSTGSGTLVARNERAGLILTCSHLFDQSRDDIFATFPNGQRYAARLLARDRAHDLAALVIQRPAIEPVAVADGQGDRFDTLTACGFGSTGQFRAICGAVVGRATPVGAIHPSLTIRGSVRPGDSGGAVLDSRGLLVGVVWGERDGLTYATCGEPVSALLARVMGENREATAKRRAEDSSRESNIASRKSEDSDAMARLGRLEQRVAALDTTKQDKGDYLERSALDDLVRRDELEALKTNELVRRTELAHYAKREHLESDRTSAAARLGEIGKHIAELRRKIARVAGAGTSIDPGLSTGALIVGALGLSGPVAIAVVLSTALVRKRFASLRGRAKQLEGAVCGARRDSPQEASLPIAIDSPPPPQKTVTETHYVPYETDSFAKAHGWASEQIARKYPGAAEVLQAQDSLIKQYLTATN